MADPLKSTDLVFNASANRIKVEFLPRPAVVPDYEHNHTQEIQLYRHRELMDKVVGTVRVTGLSLSHGVTDYILSAGTIFHKEFMVSLASPQAIPTPGSTMHVYFHITISRSGTSVVVPGGPTLDGPNYYSYSAAIETGASVPVDDATNVYIDLGTIGADGSYTEVTPLLSVPLSKFCDAKYWDSVQLFENNEPLVIPVSPSKPNIPSNFQIDSMRKVRMNYGEERYRFRVTWQYPALVNNDEVAFFELIVFQINGAVATVSTEYIMAIPASKNRNVYFADIIPTVNTHSYVIHCAIRSVTRSGKWSDWVVLGKDGNNHQFTAPLETSDHADSFMGHVFRDNVVAMTEAPVEPGLWYFNGSTGQWIKYNLDGTLPDVILRKFPEEMVAEESVVDLQQTLNEIQLVQTQIASKNRSIATAVVEGDSQSKLTLDEDKSELLSQLDKLEENVKLALDSVQYSTIDNIRDRVKVVDEKNATRLSLLSQEISTVNEVLELSREIPISFGKFSIASGSGAIVDKIPLDPGKIVKASLLVSSVSATGKVRFYADGQEADYKSVEVSAPGLVQGELNLIVNSPFVLVIDVVDGSYGNTIDMTGTLTIYYVKTK